MNGFYKSFFTGLLFVYQSGSLFAQGGAALHFDGINDYVSIPHNLALKPTTGITIEAWVKADNIHTTQYSEIYRKEDGNARHLLSFQEFGTVLSFGLEIAGIYSELDVPISSANYEGQWVHVAATYDGASKRLFRNGTLIGSQSVSGFIGTAGTAPAIIGSLSGTGEFFNGAIDELRIWNRALSPCQLQSSMNCQLALPQPGLVVEYSFNQGLAGSTNAGVVTLIGAGNVGSNYLNGTLVNFALSGTASNWIAPGGVVSTNVCSPTTISIAQTGGSNPSCAGKSLTFTASVGAGANPKYQWTKNHLYITGANSASYTANDLNDKDTIRCVLLGANNCELVRSSGIIVDILPNVTPKVLVGTDAYSAVCTSDVIQFAALAINGGTTPSYQWMKNGADIPGATDSVFGSVTLKNNDTIKCRLTSSHGCATTPSVLSKPTITKVSPVYTFIGNGSWSEPTNWANNDVAPLRIPACAQVIINPQSGGECRLDASLFISDGASFKVLQGKKFTINGNLTFSNNKVLNYYASDTLPKTKGVLLSKEKLLEVPLIEQGDETQLSKFLRKNDFIAPSYTLDMPPPGNQDQTNGCSAWAVGYGALSYINKVLEKNATYDGDDKLASPSYIYNQLNGGKNEGIYIEDALSLIKAQGCCKWADMKGDVAITTSPTAKAKENAGYYKNVEFRYERFGTVDIEKLKLYLFSNIPIVFAADTDDGFDQMKGFDNIVVQRDGRIVIVGYNYKNPTAHSMVLCGYDDNIQAFKVLNSWGEGWGNRGFIWIDYNFFKQMVIKAENDLNPWLYALLVKRGDVSITTKAVTDVQSNAATSGFTINAVTNNTTIKENGTGICYSRNPNPTTAWGNSDSTVSTNTGTAVLNGLEAGKKYYVRAFAKTNKGIVYGNEESFTTTGLALGDVKTTSALIGYSGTTTQNCHCPSGYVVVGYRGGYVAWLDNISLLCKKLNPDGTLGSDVVYTNQGGASPGAPNGTISSKDVSAPTNSALTALSVTRSKYGNTEIGSVQGRALPVWSIANKSNEGISFLQVLGNPGGDLGSFGVPSGNVLIGINVQTNPAANRNNYVSGIELVSVPIIKKDK